MRLINRAASAATVLACTGLASAQWCGDPFGSNWCGAKFTASGMRFEYDRLADRAYVFFTARWSSQRDCHGHPIPDRVEEASWPLGLWPPQPLGLPSRSCTGTTPVPFHMNGILYNDYCTCDCWYGFANIDPLLFESYTWIYNAPPATPGTFWISYDPCPGEPGKTRLVAHSNVTAAGAGLGYSVSVERVCVAAIGQANERIGEATRVTLGPSDSVPVSPCADARTTSMFRVVEKCGGVTYNTQNYLLHKSTGGTTALDNPDYSSLRNTVSTRVRGRGSFRVRSPSMVMGVRGFTAAETILTGYLDDPSLQVRWQRILDSAEPQNGVMPIELLEDGPLVGGSSLTGTHGPVLRLTGFTEHDAGTYLMRVIPAGGTIDESEVATTVHVVDDVGQPFFTQEPVPTRVCPSQLSEYPPTWFDVGVASSDPDDSITYQWYVNGHMYYEGIYIDNGFGESVRFGRMSHRQLAVNGFASANKGNHNAIWWIECEVSNSHGSARSRAVPLVVDLDTDDCDADGTTDACEIASGAADANDDGIPDACQCLADVDGNHAIDGADLGLLLSQWGPTQPTGPWFRCDLNADGRVDGADLGVLLSGWGACGN